MNTPLDSILDTSLNPPLQERDSYKKTYSFIGIRADENREGYIPSNIKVEVKKGFDKNRKKPAVMSHKSNIIPVYPFKEDGLGFDEIQDILEDEGLGFPDYYKWRSRSGCFFCFYQQIGEWQGLLEHHPKLFDKAMAYENAQQQDRITKGKKRFTWVEGKTLEQIKNMKTRYKIAEMDDTEGCAICHL